MARLSVSPLARLASPLGHFSDTSTLRQCSDVKSNGLPKFVVKLDKCVVVASPRLGRPLYDTV